MKEQEMKQNRREKYNSHSADTKLFLSQNAHLSLKHDLLKANSPAASTNTDMLHST